MVVKGVVCKKNVAHRRMVSKMEKPRLLILGGALEYQRVSNLLSSFDTLLQQVVLFLFFFSLIGLWLTGFSTRAGTNMFFFPAFSFFFPVFLIVLHPCLGNGPFEDGSGKDRSAPPGRSSGGEISISFCTGVPSCKKRITCAQY